MNKDMKILIVDDFSTMRRIIKNLLRDLGFTNTEEADDGTTALPMLENGHYDFLVTDWNMPALNANSSIVASTLSSSRLAIRCCKRAWLT